jgi:sRNA-binding protein
MMSNQENPQGVDTRPGEHKELSCNEQEELSSSTSLSPEALVLAFQQLWPQCFAIYEMRRRPLKLNIHLDVIQSSLHDFDNDQIKIGLRFYVSNSEYLKKVKVGAARIDLNGEVDGHVTKDEENHAQGQLEWRREVAKQNEKRRKNPNARKPKLSLRRRP